MDSDVSVTDLPALVPSAIVPHALNPVDAYLARLYGTTGRRTQRSALERVARILTHGRRDAHGFAWHRLTHAELIGLRETLAGKYAPMTVNTTLAAVRGVLRAAFRLGMVDGDTIARIGDVKSLPVSGLPTGRALSGPERTALVDAAAAQVHPGVACRDAALVTLLLATGARINEATEMAPSDVDGDRVVIRRAKGGTSREVPLPPKTAARVAAWLTWRTEVAPEAGERLWVRIDDQRTRPGAPLSLRSCYERVVVAGERAGFLVTPHDLRRTYATTLLGGGADPLLVAKLLGHRDTRTTLKYDRRGLETAREFLGVLDV